jgi:hypothetical protein
MSIHIPKIPLPKPQDPYFEGYLAGVKDGESDAAAHFHATIKILYDEISRDPKVSNSGAVIALAVVRIVLRIIENRTYFPKPPKAKAPK